jgi:putative SOS response-associated peptidase YedK
VCNRYTLIDPDSAFAEIARILGIPLDKPQWVVKRYNIGLMQVAPTVVNRGAGVEVLPMNFGYFSRAGANMINNARSETVYELPSFKKAVISHRCVIPTTGFIDWETDTAGRKWPHIFTLASGRPYGMAAIWNQGTVNEKEAVPPNFCIVTREPNELVGRIHNRMPVILREEHLARWLDPAPMQKPEFLKICEAYPASEMRMHEVSTYVNNVRHEGEECAGPPTPRPVNPVAPKPKPGKVDPDQMGFDLGA